MIDLKELNILLEKSELQNKKITSKLESNVDILSEICSKSQNWKENTSVLMSQSRDVDIALDIALGVDKTIREQVTKLTDNYKEEEVEKYISEVFNAIQLKSSGIGKNQREKDLYNELQQAIDQAGYKLRTAFKIQLKKKNIDLSRLKKITAILEEIGMISHLGDFLAVVIDEIEKGSNEETNEMEESLIILLQRFDQASMLFQDKKSLDTLNDEIMEKTASIYQASFFNKLATKFSSYNSEQIQSRMKHVNNFYMNSLKIQKKGVSIKPYFKVLLRFFKQFFKSVMDMLKGFERMVKNDASEYITKLVMVFKFIKIIDSNTQIITFFIKKSELVYKDAQDMALAIASQFVRSAKAKTDELRENSIIKSHIFYISVLFSIIEFSQSLRKLNDKLKTNIDVLISSGLKVYLTYCWGHVIAFKEEYSQEAETKKISKNSIYCNLYSSRIPCTPIDLRKEPSICLKNASSARK